jgi:hypothetical protein
MISLVAYALEPRIQYIYVSDDNKWRKALHTDNQALMNWLTRAAFVWMDVYLVASVVIGYHDMKDFIEFQKWLITVLLIFGTASVILLAILLCVSPDHTKMNEEDELEEEEEDGETVSAKNEIVEEFVNYVDGNDEEEEGEDSSAEEEEGDSSAEEEESDDQPFLRTGSPETATDVAESENSPSFGLRYRRAWSM